MKQLTGVIILALAILSFQLSATAAESLKIGVLDLQRCIQESNEGKRMYESLRKNDQKLQENLIKIQQDLANLNEEMNKQSYMLSTDAKERKLKEYQKNEREFVRQKKWAEEDSQYAKDDARIAILNLVSGVVEKVAKDKKLDLVTEKANGGILYVSKALDITDDVIAELNKVKP